MSYDASESSTSDPDSKRTTVFANPFASIINISETEKVHKPPPRTAVKIDPNAPTLQSFLHKAKLDKESQFSAIVGYRLKETHYDARGYDQTMLTIVLATFLGFLYTRSWQIVGIGFIIWFLFESIVWFLIPVFSTAIKYHLHSVESRDYEPLLDWLFFVIALFFAICAIEFSLLNSGAGSIPPMNFPSSGSDWAAAIAVVLVSLLSAYQPIYFLSALLLFGTIWIVYLFDQTDFHFWTAVRATLATAYFYIWFQRPIAFHFAFNAAFAIASATLILSLLTGIIVP